MKEGVAMLTLILLGVVLAGIFIAVLAFIFGAMAETVGFGAATAFLFLVIILGLIIVRYR